MEAVIASFYPPLPERQPLPTLYVPTCFLLSLGPFVIANKHLAISLTFPPLLALCLRAPYYTFGDPSSDYYNSGPFLAILLWYLDFVLLTPREGDHAPGFIGEPGAQKNKMKRWTDLSSMSQKLRWAFRLMLPAHRGIGWNWQVKGVPEDHSSKLSKWTYVRVHVWWAVFYYVQSVVMLIVLGCASALQEKVPFDDYWKVIAVDAIVGWSGAVWVWDRLNCAYSTAATLAVALNLTETWEWPPLMGPLKDTWSVRQMWRYVDFVGGLAIIAVLI
jgi:hypothetical protein